MIFLFIFFFIVLIILIFFAFPVLSPIPYYPTNWDDLDLIAKKFPLENSQTVIDLGAGSGTVIFKLADMAYSKKLDTRFVAVEINPFLVILLSVKRLFHSNQKHISIAWRDLFKTDYMTLVKGGTKSLVYLYVSPRLIGAIQKKIKHDLPKAKAVTYMYPLAGIKPTLTVTSGHYPLSIYNKI